jgi:hypothetical protein
VIVYLTLSAGNTVTIIIDDANNATIGGDVFVLGVAHSTRAWAAVIALSAAFVLRLEVSIRCWNCA